MIKVPTIGAASVWTSPATPRVFLAGTNPVGVVVGDFNLDGKPDLAVANVGLPDDICGGLSMLLGAGDGTFQAAVNYNTGTTWQWATSTEMASVGILLLGGA